MFCYVGFSIKNNRDIVNELICVIVNIEQQNAEIPKKKTFVPPPRFFNKEEARYLTYFLRMFSYPMLG